MAKGNGNHGVRDYIIIALILAVITYIEFYIVEFPLPWLSSWWVMFWLITLSVAKFFMVIWWFMHLKDDDKAYTGFFSSGMVIAMGTFVAFTFLMIAPSSLSYIRSAAAPDGRFEFGDKPGDYQLPGFGDDLRASIDTDGYSRPLAEILAAARPKDAALRIERPRAPEPDVVLLAEARPDEAEADEPDEADEADEAEAPAEAEAEAEAEPAAVEWDEALGADVYAANCASCHQGEGQGVPGAFPPLRSNVTDFAATPEGRGYLGRVILYGVQGPMTVDGVDYAGMMPALGHLGDEEIAAVLNHATRAWGNDADLADGVAPFGADEIGDLRGEGLSGGDVLDLRAEAEAAEPEPSVPDEPEDAEPDEAEPDEADEAAEPDEAAAEADAVEWDAERGAALYGANCSSCHQGEGQGLAGAFPPLRGNLTDAVAADGGRAYLVDVMLNGLQGPITVDDVDYAGFMPGWRQLDDGEIADLLNHVLHAWGNEEALPATFTPLSPDEVAERREASPSPQDVHTTREELGLP